MTIPTKCRVAVIAEYDKPYEIVAENRTVFLSHSGDGYYGSVFR